MGGTRQHYFIGINSKPHLKNQEPCRAGIPNRRLKARLEPAQATVATAHAIARVVYKMLKYKVEYDPLSVNKYQKQYEEQQIKYMKQKAAKFGFQLVPA